MGWGLLWCFFCILHRVCVCVYEGERERETSAELKAMFNTFQHIPHFGEWYAKVVC